MGQGWFRTVKMQQRLLFFFLSLMLAANLAAMAEMPTPDPDFPPDRRAPRVTPSPTPTPGLLTLDDLLARYPDLRSALCQTPALSACKDEVIFPIFTYHGFVGKDYLSVDAPSFEEQLALLKALGYTSLTLGEAGKVLSDTQRLPARPVVLTFDDGWHSQYEVAYPLLLKYGMRGTFLVLAHQERGKGEISLDELKTMIGQGMEIGSHTRTHPNLKEVTSSKAWWEINSSRELLQEQLYTPVVSFAYPYGVYDAQATYLVMRSGYEVAVTSGASLRRNWESRYRLSRIEVRRKTDLIAFVQWLPWRAPELCQPEPVPLPSSTPPTRPRRNVLSEQRRLR